MCLMDHITRNSITATEAQYWKETVDPSQGHQMKQEEKEIPGGRIQGVPCIRHCLKKPQQSAKGLICLVE